MKSPRQLDRSAELFELARALPVPQRKSFLEKQCGDDRELFANVCSLLEHHEDTDGMLDKPLSKLPILRDAAAVLTAGSRLPQKIGDYLIVGKLGSGGMGVVYLAEQLNPRRSVAVKVVHPTLASNEALQRFKLEAAVLGRLQHPGIAQIYEAGVHLDDRDEQPFFVMEYVDGVPLNEFIQQQIPKLRERLQLFGRICDAVHYAHQQGIVHRDLKPSNIFVVEPTSTVNHGSASSFAAWSAGAMPKILDFGVARATDSELQITALHTQTGQLVGTLPYMSPEQVSGQANRVDARSDVYALGVILYELLSGTLPYDLSDHAMLTAAKLIAEQEPTPLSSIDRAYRGDLNTIVLRSLEKDPDRRYPSAAELAADIQRFLDDQPIHARPPSTFYQLRKFTQRHKGLVGGVVAAFVLLIAGMIGTTSQALRAIQQKNVAAQEKELALAEAEFSSQVNAFFFRLLTSTRPNAMGSEATMAQALDHAAQSIETTPLENSRVEAEIRKTIGSAYEAIGDFSKSLHHLELALQKAVESYGADDPRLINHLTHLALTYARIEQFDQAEETYRQCIALAESVGDELAIAAGLRGLAYSMCSRNSQPQLAEQHARRALEIYQRQGHEGRDRAAVLEVLAISLTDQGDWKQAESIIDEVIDFHRNHLPMNRAVLGSCLSVLARIYGRTNRREQAVELYREVIQIQDDLWSSDHPWLTASHLNLGVALRRLGQTEEAERELRLAVELADRHFELTHPRVLAARGELGNLLMTTERLDEAEPMLRFVLQHRLELMPESRDTTTSLMNMANWHKRRGQFDLALPHVQRAYDVRRQLFAADHSLTLSAQRLLAECLLQVDESVASEQLYREIYELKSQKYGADSRQAAIAHQEWTAAQREVARVTY